MAGVALSEMEKVYVIQGVQENSRPDGRSCLDFRIIEMETDILSNCNGSAHIRLANTDLLVGVKAELDLPQPPHLNRGRIEIFVDCSSNASPEFEGRGGEDVASEISCILTQAYNNSQCLDLNSLCVIPGQQVWILYVDIVVLECGGNLVDAASLAVKAALFNTKIPAVSIKTDGECEPEIEISDDPYDVTSLDVTNFPVLITLLRVGSQFIVDATQEEEVCSKTKLVIAVTASGSITLTKKVGWGSFHPESILDVLETGQNLGVNLNNLLLTKLKSESPLKKDRRSFFITQ